METPKEPEFTKAGYPTEQTLQVIRSWPIHETGLQPLLQFMRDAWKYTSMITEQGSLWVLSTGGWSGNEDLMDAFDTLPWLGLAKSSAWFAGGHYVIALTNGARIHLDKARQAFFDVLRADDA